MKGITQVLGVRGGVVLDLNRRQMSSGDCRQCHRDDDARPHAEHSDSQSTEDRRECKSDPVGGADEAIGPVMAIYGDEQGDCGG